MEPHRSHTPEAARTRQDRVLVFGGSDRTLDLLRLAIIRTDDVVLVGGTLNAAAERFAQNFAVEVRRRPAKAADLGGANAVLIAIGDAQAENRLVRAARRRRVPVHVADRELVSDFRMLDFLEQRALAA